MKVAEYEKNHQEREAMEVPRYTIYIYFWLQ